MCAFEARVQEDNEAAYSNHSYKHAFGKLELYNLRPVMNELNVRIYRKFFATLI
jgi:hypothetical protein